MKVEPKVDFTSFNCPHCGALAQQFWYSAAAEPLGRGKVPRLHKPGESQDALLKSDPDTSERLRQIIRLLGDGKAHMLQKGTYCEFVVGNVNYTVCYNCENVGIWIFDRLLWPTLNIGPQRHSDLPSDLHRDYDEASAILNISPRGSAAFLRLILQKLCVHLGEKGQNINEDIGKLVSKGLDPKIQKALDIVRVIGNEAVHPGEIDIKDDYQLARTLFDIINIIVETMISQPKQISELYESLPGGKLEAIKKRDGSL